MKKGLIRHWYQTKLHPSLYLLTPLTAFYRLLMSIRRQLYRFRLKSSTKFSVPVIVVGNVTVGGTGKTPMVIWLADYLRHRGWRPGIVSRGYGGRALVYPCWVTPDSPSHLVGDEPTLIAKRTHCPVVVDPQRVRAVQALLQTGMCNIVISDDGLQHYALQRDIEIALIDGQRRFGNGYCLPIGPLREPVTRLKECDFVLTNGVADKNEWQVHLKPGHVHNLLQPHVTLSPQQNHGAVVHAVAGIGNPSRFFNTLREMGWKIIEHPFPDHHHFTVEDFAFAHEGIVIMTEKDAVKCRKFLRPNFWCLPVSAEPDTQFVSKFAERMANLSNRRQD